MAKSAVAMSHAKELRGERAKLIADARKVLDTAEGAKREPTAEERAQFDALMVEADKLQERFERVEKLEAAEATLAESAGRQVGGDDPGRKPGETRSEDRRGTDEYRAAFDTFLRNGKEGLSGEQWRALQFDVTPSGGYLAPPQAMVNELIKFVDNSVVIRPLATKFSVGEAGSLGAPSLDADPADADWTSELGTGSEDSTMAFGKRELTPRPLAKRIKVSNKLLRVSNAEAVVTERLANKLAVPFEKACMTGDGAHKPLGVFVASTDGITTARDVSTDNTATAFTADGLINAKYSLKEGYLRSPSLRWLFHRDAVKMARKLKDGMGQYLWQPGLSADRGDTLLDVPILMSEYVPNTFTTGQYVGLIGDFSYYWIADSAEISIQKLEELYAETNQTGFIGRLDSDAMPVLAE
ncbi:MAG: phage major capsid protein, partial [Acidobacteriales bacterium]|nr:phage major capsid protein [Terriglobales bacterium]